MAGFPKSTHMELNRNQLRKVIQNNLVKGPSKDYITEVLLDCFEQENDYKEKFLHAIMGNVPSLKYSVGDTIYFKGSCAPSDYLWNKIEMEKQNLITKDGIIEGTIVRVNSWATKRQYKVAYTVVKDKKIIQEQCPISEMNIMVEEFPGDGADDLPF